MQVRQVRMEESRSLAHSSPRGLGYTASIILGRRGSDCIQTSRSLHADRPQPPGLSVDRPGDENATENYRNSAPLRQHKPPEPPPSSIAPHSVPHSPQPPRKARGGFVIRAGIVASFSKPSSDYARRDKDGTALWTCPINPTLPRSPNKDNPVFSKSRGGPPAWYTGRPPIQ